MAQQQDLFAPRNQPPSARPGTRGGVLTGGKEQRSGRVLGDIHRASVQLAALGPWTFTGAELAENAPVIGYNADGAVYAKTGGQCDQCGQPIASVYRFQNPKGARITLGEDCALTLANNSDKKLVAARAAAHRAALKEAAKTRKAAVFAAQNQATYAAELATARALRDANPPGSFAHTFATDLIQKLSTGGAKTVSDKQKALLARLADEARPSRRRATESEFQEALERLDRWGQESGFRGDFSRSLAAQLRAGRKPSEKQKELYDRFFAEEARGGPKHVGKVGQKVSLEAEVAFIAEPRVSSYMGHQSVSTFVALRTGDGDKLAWNGSNFPGRMVDHKGQRVRLTGTVKAHDLDKREGHPVTVLERVAIEPIDPPEDETGRVWWKRLQKRAGEIARGTTPRCKATGYGRCILRLAHGGNHLAELGREEWNDAGSYIPSGEIDPETEAAWAAFEQKPKSSRR